MLEISRDPTAHFNLILYQMTTWPEIKHFQDFCFCLLSKQRHYVGRIWQKILPNRV